MIRRPISERFWEKVYKTAGCWQWIGAFDSKGYGRVWGENRIETASRVSWFLEHGTWPGSLFVCHHCDNRACVNPEHLFLGTQSDNIKDAYKKGRQSPPSSAGERNCHAVLTRQIVRRIRATKGKTPAQLAILYGVTRASIYHVLSGYTWKEIA